MNSYDIISLNEIHKKALDIKSETKYFFAKLKNDNLIA